MPKYIDAINDDFVSQYKDKTPPWGPVGYCVYKRTYARKVEGEGRTEEWWETVRRCCNGIIKIGGKFTDKEIRTLYDKVFNLKCNFSGRALWQLGTETVDRLGGDSMMNCWGINCNDPVGAFCFTFEELMLGGGVGFNVQREFVYEMPKVKYDVRVVRRDEKDVDFIVPDNREGWVELLRRVLNAFYFTGKSFDYSTICVRGKGAVIKSFGGTASGPEDLCEGIDHISRILRGRVGKKLRPIDCLDIMDIIGSIVVAGNVRRSALLCLGDMDDRQYLDAKNWSKGAIPNWRAMSNNSVVCNEIEHLPSKFWSGYNGEGEPYGLVNLKNCQTYGRIVDGKGYRPDKNVSIVNPCAEIALVGHSGIEGQTGGESCNLAEIYLPNLKDEREFCQVAELALKATKTISCLSFLYDGTNEIVSKNHRLGIGVTGFLQSEHLRKPEIFENVYRRVEEADKKYSKVLGVKPSIKLTTTKPSGCRPWHALTVTDQGILTLEELLKDHPEGQSWADLRSGTRAVQGSDSDEISKTYHNGESDIVRINMHYGFSVESTPDHPWWIDYYYDESKGERYQPVNDWVAAKDIKPNHVLRMDPNMYVKESPSRLRHLSSLAIKMRGDATEINQPSHMNYDLAWLLGYLWGDGVESPEKYRIRFVDAMKCNLVKARNVLEEQFGIGGIKIHKASEARNAFALEVGSKMLWHWLIKNDFYKYSAESVDLIPKLVRSSSKVDILAFLAGLIDADGHVAARAKENTVVLSASCDIFAKHLQDVAASVGIVFGRSLNGKGDNFQNRKHMWLMTMSPESNKDSFSIMEKFSNKMLPEMKMKPDLPWSHDRLDRKKTRILGKVCSCKKLARRQQTYDIEVSNSHWYYAGAFKSHNTLSLLPGVTPGVHPSYAPYYIRRIRMASSDPLVEKCREHGFHVEPVVKFDGTHDHGTMVVSFPIKTPEGAVVAQDVSAVQQMEWANWLQTHWADNSVSVTVYYRKEELPEIKAWLKENYNEKVKTISFLLHSDHGFAQAPLEIIDEDAYKKMSSKTRPITRVDDDCEREFAEKLECESGSCPVK